MTRVSLVMCTRNRADTVEMCLAHVESLLEDDCEFIVVNNGSTDGTAQILSLYSERNPLVRIVDEPVPGLARARNAGLAEAAGDIIAFIDDDCYPAPTYIRDLTEVFDRRSDIGFVAGRVLLHDPLDLPLAILDFEHEQEFPPFTYLRAGSLHGANLAFRSAVLETIGGFDDRMGAGTPFPVEDLDAAARALWAGYPGLYSPSPTVRHHHRRRSDEDRQKILRSYDAGRGAYFAKFITQRSTRRVYLAALGKHVAADILRERRLSRTIHEIESALKWARSERHRNRRSRTCRR